MHARRRARGSKETITALFGCDRVGMPYVFVKLGEHCTEEIEDLWFTTIESYDDWSNLLLGGGAGTRGMNNFSVIDAVVVRSAIQSFISGDKNSELENR